MLNISKWISYLHFFIFIYVFTSKLKNNFFFIYTPTNANLISDVMLITSLYKDELFIISNLPNQQAYPVRIHQRMLLQQSTCEQKSSSLSSTSSLIQLYSDQELTELYIAKLMGNIKSLSNQIQQPKQKWISLKNHYLQMLPHVHQNPFVSDNLSRCTSKADTIFAGIDRMACQFCGQKKQSGQLEQMKTCSICNKVFCNSCLGRDRVIPKYDGQLEPKTIQIASCQECDEQYLMERISLQERKNLFILEQIFFKLTEEQSEDIIDVEKLRQDRQKTIHKYQKQNKQIKQQIGELEKKIGWGKQVKIQLEKRLKEVTREAIKMKAIQGQQEIRRQSQLTIKPPRAYSSSISEVLNETNAQTTYAQGQSQVIDKRLCSTCILI